MFNSPIELIASTASNSLFVFCFCNFIIVVLLISGSKPALDHAQGCADVPPRVTYEYKIDMGETKEENVSTEDSELGIDEANNHEKDEKEEGDDELRRRVEEFIEKTNRKWKEEKLRTYNMELEFAMARSWVFFFSRL